MPLRSKVHWSVALVASHPTDDFSRKWMCTFEANVDSYISVAAELWLSKKRPRQSSSSDRHVNRGPGVYFIASAAGKALGRSCSAVTTYCSRAKASVGGLGTDCK
ncbi:hypothetical protein QAD02_017399 [Eretmocerus hayati]|uniref:Uncharacterized protein n=1 Tax=Eretmocerus hayati TaxID=131215 RepID=A0ACC2PE82_9HYME|nr:hypothetical protein QAD02_017399 [Eretmocerus hayati]